MKNTIIDNIQRKGLRLSLCALALSFCSVSYAQDDMDEIESEQSTTFKAPKRRTVADKNTLVSVSGTVIDNATKVPVAGVRVQMLGNPQYTAMSNAKGEFTIQVPDFATALYVQAPRYSAQQVAIRSNDPSQQVKISLLSEKFLPMYTNGTTYTAASEFNVRGGSVVLDDEIQSNLGGDIRSINRSGVADGGNAMFIRGLASINGNAQPLIIVDGVEQDMQQDRTVLHLGRSMNMLANISPEDIQKVTVLKNATALYGSRGANGVILIETKRGHSMATRIDANISAGVTLKPTQLKMLNADQYRNYATELLGTIPALQKSENRGIPFNFLNDDPNGYYYQMYHNDTNWQDQVYRTAVTQNYNINVQGGDDIGMYNLSVGYMDADSPIKETNFNRLNVRFNTDIKLLWNFTTKFDMSFSRTNNTMFDDGFASDLSASTITSPAALALVKSPFLSPYQYNKRVGGFTELLSPYDDYLAPLSNSLYGNDNDYAYSLANPTAIISTAKGDNKNKVENTFFNVHVEPTFQFNDHWSATTLFSYVLNRNSQRYYRPSEGVPPFEVAGLGVVYNMTSSLFAKQTNVLSNTHVDWKQAFGAHSIAATGGFRYNYFSYDGSDASSQYRGSQDDKNPYLTADPSTAYSLLAGANDVWKNMQWYINADYNYKNRYFATFSVLAEANSRFGKNSSSGVRAFGTNWAVFPSLQFGWVLTNEDWFPKNNIVNYLRINAGFDVSGNDNISYYATQTSFSSVRYNYNAIGMQLANIGNDKIKWETTQKWNFGIVANLFNNRLGVSFDYFIHNTSDLLTIQNFGSPVAGINTFWTNGGSLRNNGFELGISGKPVASKDWNLEIGMKMGHYKNEVTKLPNGNYTTSVYGDNNILTSEGNPVAMFYGYKTNGIYSTNEEAVAAGKDGEPLYIKDAANNKSYFGAGDVRFVDQNGDGEINEKDKVIIGNPNPDIYGNIFAALNWKRFTLNLGFNYSVGNDVYNYQRYILTSGSEFQNQHISSTGRWRYEGQKDALLPKAQYQDPMGNNRFSDRWIEDGSYLRLKNIRLTYQIPVPESWQSWLQGLSVWGEAQNVFTITKYTGLDPEFSAGNSVLYQGIDNGSLSQCRSFVFGLKINL